ncbi:winged helix-turn-helix domain-containing protein [Enterobacter cloacae]|uniref:winged helix-turn-helix domain-containing protein n=1 Tax=Enterobacter cloacae TaxID=550 RepID=UPI0020029BEF|nr:winged helix-turn-helix domain-containing protein [Enterobacter cloacae]MCK7177124.1 winged helix-turn-helix domain-containing protein [Enterobacter cloacae]
MENKAHWDKENDRIYIHEKSGVVFYKGKKIGTLGVTERKLLIFLISKNGSEASKDELTEVGWHNRVTVPNSLNMAIRKIRLFFKEMGFDGLIMTIPRYGFSLPTPEIFIVFTHEEFDNENNIGSHGGEIHSPAVNVNKKFTRNRFFWTLVVILFSVVAIITTNIIYHGKIKKNFVFPKEDTFAFQTIKKCSFRSYGNYTQKKSKALIQKVNSLIEDSAINCGEEQVDVFLDIDGSDKSRPLIMLISYCYVGKKNQYYSCDNFRAIYAK